jgi:hypothetical protein
VCLIIFAGILLSVLLYQYLHRRELDSFHSQLQLLCLERSNTVQSQLNFSTTVLHHFLAYFDLVKSGSPTASLQPFGSSDFLARYAEASDAFKSLNFLLMTSVLRNVDEMAAWTGNLNHTIAYFKGRNRTVYDWNDPNLFYRGPFRS